MRGSYQRRLNYGGNHVEQPCSSDDVFGLLAGRSRFADASST